MDLLGNGRNQRRRLLPPSANAGGRFSAGRVAYLLKSNFHVDSQKTTKPCTSIRDNLFPGFFYKVRQILHCLEFDFWVLDAFLETIRIFRELGMRVL